MPTILLTAVCIVGWGLWSIAIRQACRYTTPMMIQLIAMYVYSAIAPVMFLLMKSQSMIGEWPVPAILWTTVACVLTTAAGTAFIYALQKSQVHMVLGMTSCYPVLTFLLCWAFLGEDVTPKKFLGIVTIVIGTILIGL